MRRRGKSLMVSPMDWSLITTWRDSGVPLHVALRGVDIAMDKFFSGTRRASERPGTLFYCHDAVMAEYARYLEAHVGESSQGDSAVAASGGPGQSDGKESGKGPGKSQIGEFLSARISEINTVLAKHSMGDSACEGIERIRCRLEELAGSLESSSQIELEELERDLGILDDLLVTSLLPEIPPDLISDWEQEAKKELKIYKKKLPKETYEKIRDNFMRGKIHRKFNLGELSLFHL
ncbi:MAG TPA: hypothetical protein VE398_07060 [Acidobacteriota bacterium]|nr:hypothetical protein [Acidobacteriota bacterium]